MQDTTIFESDIGRVFTPVHWAEWCLLDNGVYDAWREGATVFDPTCGTGSFFKALANIARQRHETITADDLNRLYGIEIVASDKFSFLADFANLHGLEFPEANLVTDDFLFHKKLGKFDYAVGNPPWCNFADLPDDYKSHIKHVFVEYGLVEDKRNVLLGGSRIDIASLVISKCMKHHVVKDGAGIFFIPLSLFFNGPANEKFRPSLGSRNEFTLKKLIDFDDNNVFQKISTRNGLAVLQKSQQQIFPINCIRVAKNMETEDFWAGPIQDTNMWIQSKNREDFTGRFSRVKISQHQQPRQGMNSCGLNKVFIFEREYDKGNRLDDNGTLTNGYGEKVTIETDFIFPLLNAASFGGKKPKTQKFILCPYRQNGKELTWDEINRYPLMATYLHRFRKDILNRKGVLIRNKMKNGMYWSMLGVGPYSFSPWKVAWEAMGRRDFRATVVSGRWQGNQSLHAFIPCDDMSEATKIKNELNITIPKYLKATRMEGTCNWAQPGRIKPFLEIEQMEQFL